MSANECGSPPETVSMSVSIYDTKIFAHCCCCCFFFLLSSVYTAILCMRFMLLKINCSVRVDHCFEQWLVILMIKCFAGQTFFEFGINLWIHIWNRLNWQISCPT